MTKSFARSSALLLLMLTLGFPLGRGSAGTEESQIRLSVFGGHGRYPVAACLGATKKTRHRGHPNLLSENGPCCSGRGRRRSRHGELRPGSLWSKPSRAA